MMSRFHLPTVGALAVLALLYCVTTPAVQAQPGLVITFDQLCEDLKRQVPEEDLLKRLADSPTLFTLSQQQETQLKQLGASPALIAAIKARTRKAATAGPGDIRSFIIILDCSGSMMDKDPEGVTKFHAARQALLGLVKAIPDGREVAFIVYGSNPAQRCQDVEVLLPLSEFDPQRRERLVREIGELQATGYTPLALALRKAGAELARAKGMTKVIVLTDGLDTCDGKPEQEAAALAENRQLAGVEVLGLSLKTDESQAVQAIARTGRGRYYDVKTVKELETALGQVEKEAGLVQALTLKGHTRHVEQVIYSPDGKLIATAGVDKTLRTWDAGTGKQVLLVPHQAEVLCASFSSDSRRIAVGSWGGVIAIHEATGGKLLAEMNSPEGVALIAFSPDDQYLATVGKDVAFGDDEAYRVTIWDVATGKSLRVLKGHSREIHDMAFAPGKNILVTVSSDSTIRVWDIEKGEELHNLPSPVRVVNTVRFNADGSEFLTGHEDNTLARWNLKTGEQVLPLLKSPGQNAGGLIAAGYLNDGRIIGFHYSGGVVIFETSRGQVVAQVPSGEIHLMGLWSYPGNKLALSPDGQMFARAYVNEVQLLRIGDIPSPGK